MSNSNLADLVNEAEQSVYAYKAPWNKDYERDWFTRNKRNRVARNTYNKKEFKALHSSYPTRDIRSSLTGDVYTMPKQDYTELVNSLNTVFTAKTSELSDMYKEDGKQRLKNIQTPADYIDYAFNKKSQQKQITEVECKGGHIRKLTYNPLYKVLMVEFTNNGTKCVFFNLPANVAATLIYHAENNTPAINPKSGGDRHQVGVEFWNLVRVRGSLHDTRYPFVYAENNNSGESTGRPMGSGNFVYAGKAMLERMGDDVSMKNENKPVKSRRYTKEEFNAIMENSGGSSYEPSEYYDFIDDFFSDANGSQYFNGNGYNKIITTSHDKNRLSKLVKAMNIYQDSDEGDEQNLRDIIRLMREAGIKI